MAPTRKPVNHVAVINRSELPDATVAIMVEAYREWLKAVCQAWMLPVPGLAFYDKEHAQEIEEEAAIIFTDSTSVPDAFGFHEALGLARFGYVDLGMCRRYDEDPSRVFGHELIELVVDPDCDSWIGPYGGPGGYHVAKELCDPVQRFSTTVQAEYLGAKAAVELADFILPAWFDEHASTGPYSYLNIAQAPLKNASGGYFLLEQDGLVTSEGMVRVKSYGRTLERLLAGRETEPVAA
jgi:hypothetical protein